jgi:hypothetical protein
MEVSPPSPVIPTPSRKHKSSTRTRVEASGEAEVLFASCGYRRLVNPRTRELETNFTNIRYSTEPYAEVELPLPALLIETMGKLETRKAEAKFPSPELVTLSDGEEETEGKPEAATTVHEVLGTHEEMTVTISSTVSIENQNTGDGTELATITQEINETPKDVTKPLPSTQVSELEKMDFEPPPGRPQAHLRQTLTPKPSEASSASPASPVLTAEEEAHMTEQLGEVDLELRRQRKRGKYYRCRNRRQQHKAKEPYWQTEQGECSYSQHQYDQMPNTFSTTHPQWYPSAEQNRWPHTTAAQMEQMSTQQPYATSVPLPGWSAEFYPMYTAPNPMCTQLSYICPCYRCEVWRKQ